MHLLTKPLLFIPHLIQADLLRCKHILLVLVALLGVNVKQFVYSVGTLDFGRHVPLVHNFRNLKTHVLISTVHSASAFEIKSHMSRIL